MTGTKTNHKGFSPHRHSRCSSRMKKTPTKPRTRNSPIRQMKKKLVNKSTRRSSSLRQKSLAKKPSLRSPSPAKRKASKKKRKITKKKAIRRTMSRKNEKIQKKFKNASLPYTKELKYKLSAKRLRCWTDEKYVIETLKTCGWDFLGEPLKNGSDNYPKGFKDAIRKNKVGKDECLIWADDYDGQILAGYSEKHVISVIPDSHRALSKTYQQLLFNEFEWFPQCFTLPKESNKLKAYIRNQNEQTYFICKPRSSYGGSGMMVYRANSKAFNSQVFGRKSEFVVQQYAHRPYLFGGFYKFHIRAYFVITNVSPLRAYLYKDGQVEFATVPFDLERIEKKFCKYAHITNYKISNEKKNKSNMIKDKPGIGIGTEWELDSFFKYLCKHESKFSQKDFWRQLSGMSKIVAERIANCHYVQRACKKAHMGSHFELFGIDVLMDEKFQLSITEANTQPGLEWTDPCLSNGEWNERTVAANLITVNIVKDTVKLIGFGGTKKAAAPWVKLH